MGVKVSTLDYSSKRTMNFLLSKFDSHFLGILDIVHGIVGPNLQLHAPTDMVKEVFRPYRECLLYACVYKKSWKT